MATNSLFERIRDLANSLLYQKSTIIIPHNSEDGTNPPQRKLQYKAVSTKQLRAVAHNVILLPFPRQVLNSSSMLARCGYRPACILSSTSFPHSSSVVFERRTSQAISEAQRSPRATSVSSFAIDPSLPRIMHSHLSVPPIRPRPRAHHGRTSERSTECDAAVTNAGSYSEG